MNNLLKECRDLIDAMAKRDYPDGFEADRVEDAERLIRQRGGSVYWSATVLARLNEAVKETDW